MGGRRGADGFGSEYSMIVVVLSLLSFSLAPVLTYVLYPSFCLGVNLVRFTVAC